MKKIILFFIIIHYNAWSKSYYFSNDGNDSNTGVSETSAWRSIKKFNEFKFSKGDRVFFHKGDIFFGTLKIEANNILIGSYGAGKKPIFSAQKSLTKQWTKLSNGLWQYAFENNKPETIKGLISNNRLLPISRMPNKENKNDYFFMENIKGSNNFSSKDLHNKSSLAGYEIVIRTERYREIRTKILSSTGSSVTINNVDSIKELNKGFGFFIVNNKNAIDKEGEWAYEANSGVIYLKSKKNPNTIKISYSGSQYIFNVTNSTDFVVKDIELKYASKNALNVSNSDNVTIEGVDISNSIGNGINLVKVIHAKITNCKISNIGWTGIFVDKTNQKIVISNNIISNIGNESFAKAKTFIGIDCNASFSTIQNNIVKNTGYSGIISAGRNNLIKYNVIDSTCVLLNDCGGIYLNNNINNVYGTVIEKNFISNSIGELKGAPSDRNLANGVYLDVGSNNVTVKSNSIFNIKGSGIFVNYTKGNNTIRNNVVYNCGLSEFYIAGHPNFAPKLIINSNVFASSEKTGKLHKIFNSSYTKKYNIADIAILKNNFFISLYDAKELFVDFSAKNKNKNEFNFNEWINLINTSNSSEANAFINADELILVCNPSSNIKKTKISDGIYHDVKGKKKSSEIELEPFESVILFKKN